MGFRHNYKHYYYLKNAQEDIIGIMDSDYNVIANYKYDAYGKVVSIIDNEKKEITDTNHIAYINPFRYRSYYYDEETKLYYLNSRYYNPLFGRFINSDTVIAGRERITLSNMFAYAENNPIMNIDTDGNFAIAIIFTGAAVIAGIAYAINKMVEHHNTKGEIGIADWARYVSEGAQRAVGIASLGMTVQSAYDAASFTYNAHKVQAVQSQKNVQSASVSTTKVHGNSLSTTKPAQGYALVPRNNPKVILKYGETTMGTKRYSDKFLDDLVPGGAKMDFRASGTKYDMHYWQHDMIIDYKNYHNGDRPPFNKSDW